MTKAKTNQNPKNNRAGAKSAAVFRQNENGFDLRLSGIVGDTSYDDFGDGFSSDKIDELTNGIQGPGVVRINSPGGLVFEGIAIYNMLSKLEGVTVRVEGLAASIASVIAMAGSRVEMERGSMLMIHNPWNVAMGDSRELRKSADVLDQIRESLLDIYVAKSGLERGFITEMLDEETWLSAEEAVEWGFADGIVGEDDSQAQARINELDLSILANATNAPQRIAAMATSSAIRRDLRAAKPAKPEPGDSIMTDKAKQDAAAAEAERKRVNTIKKLCAEKKLGNSFRDQLIDDGVELSDAENRIEIEAKAQEERQKKADEDAAAKAARNAVEAERKRVNTIKKLCAEKKLDNGFRDQLIDDGVELADAENRIDMLANYLANTPANGISGVHSMEITRDEVDTRRSAVATALLHRFNPRSYKVEGDSPAREYSGMSLMEIARNLAERSGKRTKGMTKTEVARAALHSTSDFPSILENVMSKSLRDRYELAPRTFIQLANQATLPDYKEVSRPQLGEAPQLQKVLEGGEYEYGTIGDATEKYSLVKYGKLLAVTSETIINDDLDAFTRLPAAMGAAAGQLESQLFWAHFTGNPTMWDTTALFAAGHGNLAGSGSAISISSLGAGRTAMRKQKGLDGDHFINVQPEFLVVPAALETVAEQFVSTNLTADASGNINPFAGRLQVISEPHLDAASATAWYLWANPSMIDTIEYGYLEGEEGPQIETEEGFDVDGVKVKVRHNFGVKALDWRGLYKNAGA